MCWRLNAHWRWFVVSLRCSLLGVALILSILLLQPRVTAIAAAARSGLRAVQSAAAAFSAASSASTMLTGISERDRLSALALQRAQTQEALDELTEERFAIELRAAELRLAGSSAAGSSHRSGDAATMLRQLDERRRVLAAQTEALEADLARQ